VSWNIQGLRDKLTYLYDDLFSFDVISLIETWNDYSPISPLPGYLVEKTMRNVARNNRHYGGILVLAKASAIEGHERISSRSENLLWLYIYLKCGKQLILDVVYLPPQNILYSRENSWEILEEELSSMQESHRDLECVLMGDFNAYTGLEAEIPDVLIPDLGDFIPIFVEYHESTRMEKEKEMYGEEISWHF